MDLEKLEGEINLVEQEEEEKKKKEERRAVWMQLVKKHRVETGKDNVASVGSCDEDNMAKKWLCQPTHDLRAGSFDYLD